jgi:hypothetical protein
VIVLSAWILCRAFVQMASIGRRRFSLTTVKDVWIPLMHILGTKRRRDPWLASDRYTIASW